MSCVGQCHCKGQKENQSEILSMKDEVWGSDDENISTYADLQRAHINQGYLDGITKAQESGLQEGFDQAFPSGAALGIRVGRILAKLHGSVSFSEAQKALNITKVLDKKYFDDQLELKDSQHPLLEKWEKVAADTQV
ncbi:hypothetical protein OXX69_006726 [Metschnikowia pulcherrima]